MPTNESAVADRQVPGQRARELFLEGLDAVHRRCDRLFCWLAGAQWVFALFVALVASPYSWEGHDASIHVHVWMAVFMGGTLSLPIIALTVHRPGSALTRHVIAIAQMLWSGLLVHLTGGRIETHFH